MATASMTIWCLLTIWTLIPAVHLEEEELNETVICTNEQIQVTIPSAFFLNKDPPVFIWDLHLNDPECRGVETGNDYVFTIKTNLTDCGTIMASDESYIMFTNTIHNNETDVITRSYVNITFGCRYPANYMVQQPNGENMIRVDVRTITLDTEDGNFSVSMLLYKDEDFEDKWTTVPSLMLDDNIYVKVFMSKFVGNQMKVDCLITSSVDVGLSALSYNKPLAHTLVYSQPHWKSDDCLDECLLNELFTRLFGNLIIQIPANLMLRVERCWATPNQDPYSNIQYTFIKESCPVLTNDQKLAVMKNGQGTEALFRIQMFKFVGTSYTDIFLHCNVQICHSSAGACRPNCSTEDASARIRRDVALSHTVSYGPIKRREVPTDKNILDTGKTPLETFVLGGLLVVLLLITGVFGRLWYKSKRSYPTQEAQLTLSNIHHISEVAS